MARLWDSGFELNSTGAGVEWGSVTGSTISSTTKRTGGYSGRVSSLVSATPQGFVYQHVSVAASLFFLRVYLNVATLPSASNLIMSYSNSTTLGTAMRGQITLEADGTLILRNNTGTQIGSASAVLSLNTWYMVEFKMDNTPASGSRILEARLEGSVFATSNTITTLGTASTIQLGGNLNSEAQTTGDWFLDDLAVNDATGANQTSYPGSGKILRLKPSAAGDINGFLAQVGGTAGSANNFTRVNEVTPDDATSYNGSAVLSAEDLFNMDDSGIGSTDTINVVSVGLRMADLVGADATAAFKVEIEKTSGGTKSQSATIIPNSTIWRTNSAAVPRNNPLITYADPDGAAWTQTTLDSMQAGYIQTATNVQSIAISTLWVQVDYTPAAVVASGRGTYKTLTGVGI